LGAVQRWGPVLSSAGHKESTVIQPRLEICGEAGGLAAGAELGKSAIAFDDPEPACWKGIGVHIAADMA
jgi:hypothetical protein